MAEGKCISPSGGCPDDCRCGGDCTPRCPSDCRAVVQAGSGVRRQHYAESAARRKRALRITALLAAIISGGFIIVQLVIGAWSWQLEWVNISASIIFLIVPALQRFGELVPPITLIIAAYASIFASCWDVGTGLGSELFYLVAASLLVVLLGIEHIKLAAVLAGVAACLVIILEFSVPRNTGLEPAWVVSVAFILTTVSACGIVVATIWFTLRDTARAEIALEAEYTRSEALLANILPVSIADRLKQPGQKVIADRYDDAGVLFADIAGFTKLASHTPAHDLVKLLDRQYNAFDELAEKHGMEKIKVTGDSYMVVSGVPDATPDHIHALADFALDLAETAATLNDSQDQPMQIRIGFAAGPVVAGVVGSRRFFYDVWGDVVNLASRMESTGSVGRIQVPQAIYERLKEDFTLHERGEVDIKGKGVIRTWYLVGRNKSHAASQRSMGQRNGVDI
ncbi:adenylate/guanylate cyclase domain-containing protein [Mycobacterium angelicum]|uniref:adenylate/guanylate cyclase domain-containing protein n=1 Tax=Mycobacterium angelicum TaxID=470074 RepID=UPI0009F40FD8|nr:adenylate/guanylate cyclase domain-containing protein [Mycobacterium angelicum]